MTTNETYNNKVVRQFAIMTIIWGIVGMTVGVFIAAHAMSVDATLVTNDERDFRGYPGLKVENWVKAG